MFTISKFSLPTILIQFMPVLFHDVLFFFTDISALLRIFEGQIFILNIFQTVNSIDFPWCEFMSLIEEFVT